MTDRLPVGSGHTWIRKTLLLSLLVLPPLALVTALVIHWVNIPYWDQWGMAPIFVKYHEGLLSLQDFVCQHNESRKFFPRLFFLGLGLATNWDVRAEMIATVSVSFIIWLNLLRIISKCPNILDRHRKLAWGLSGTLLFSLAQWENYFWGIQIICFVPALLLTTGLLINLSRRPLRTKVLWLSFLALVATYTYANGMLLWLLLIPPEARLIGSVRADRHTDRRETSPWFFLYLAFAVITVSTYFIGYERPVCHPSFTCALEHPLQTLRFFVVWLGNPLFPDFTGSARVMTGIVGATSLLIFLWLTIRLFCISSLRPLLRQAYPFVVIGIYSLISGAVTAAGRVGFDHDMSADSRYVTFSLFLPVSIIGLFFLSTGSLFPRESRRPWLRALVVWSLSILMCSSLVRSNLAGLSEAKNFKSRLVKGIQALRLHRLGATHNNVGFLCYSAHFVIEQFSDLKKHHMLAVTALPADLISRPQSASSGRIAPPGFLDACETTDDGFLIATGWARRPQQAIPFEAVVLACTTASGTIKPLAVTFPNLDRPDVVRHFNNGALLKSGFQMSVALKDLPQTNVVFTAWTIDIENQTAHRLKQTHSLALGPTAVSP